MVSINTICESWAYREEGHSYRNRPRTSAYRPANRTGAGALPSCSAALVYSSVTRRSAASCVVASSLCRCRRTASISVTATPMPAAAASAVRAASIRASRGQPAAVPGQRSQYAPRTGHRLWVTSPWTIFRGRAIPKAVLPRVALSNPASLRRQPRHCREMPEFGRHSPTYQRRTRTPPGENTERPRARCGRSGDRAKLTGMNTSAKRILLTVAGAPSRPGRTRPVPVRANRQRRRHRHDAGAGPDAPGRRHCTLTTIHTPLDNADTAQET